MCVTVGTHQPRDNMTHRVSVPQRGIQLDVNDDETIVEAAMRLDVDYPFSCHSGICGTCKSRLVSGDVALLDYSKFTLPDIERAAGIILACRAIPKSDCEVVPIGDANPICPKHLSCKVTGINKATHDIKIITLATPGDTPLNFLAGQFAELTFPQLPARSYSMANRPGERLLDFHVRLMPGGKASTFVHEGLATGDVVEFYGPLGTSYLRDDHTGPILALAGGSGLGPIKSIIDTKLAIKPTTRIHFYFGVRDEHDLYFARHFQDLSRRFENLKFTPVLSQPSAPTNRRTGFLCDAIEADFTNVAGYKAYVAGPPVMVETSFAALEARGLAPADFHADAF
jgi:naphthalene 1,2-dioxygenase ferredoxin reductase component